MDSKFNLIALRKSFLVTIIVVIFSLLLGPWVLAQDQGLVRNPGTRYVPSNYARIGSGKFAITPSGLAAISNLQGSFYPFQARGKWVVIVGEPESLYIGKPSKDYRNQLILGPNEIAVVWVGVLNPALMAKQQSNAFSGISYSPIYSIYGESITSQMFHSKSAVDYLLTSVDTGLMLLSIGAASWSDEALKAPQAKYAKLIRASESGQPNTVEVVHSIRGKIYERLINIMSKLKVGPDSKVGRFATRLWESWVNFFDVASRRALAKRLALYAAGYLAYKQLAQPRILSIAGSNIQAILNLSEFAYVSYDHPAILAADVIYHAHSTSLIPFRGSAKEKLGIQKLSSHPGKVVRFISSYLIHIPGLEDRVSRLFRSAGPRYTLIYTFDQGQLRLDYAIVPKVIFSGRNINIISRSTFASYLSDPNFTKFLEDISGEIASKYKIRVDPAALGSSFYTAPVELPDSYFNQLTGSGSKKITSVLLFGNPGVTPAEAIYLANLQEGNDYYSHSPSTWKRILYGVGAGASYAGAAALGVAGASVLLAAASAAAVLTGVGLVVLAAGLVVAGTYFGASAVSSWEITNVVYVPPSVTGTKYTTGDRVSTGAAAICLHLYSLAQRIQGKSNVSEAIEKCSSFGNDVRKTLADLVGYLANSPVAPLFEALHIDLKGLHNSLVKESLPLTLDWYYYYPADVVYVPKLTSGVIYISCIDNVSCLASYEQTISEL